MTPIDRPECQRCRLYQQGCLHAMIPGRGNPHAKIMFISDHPRKEEDETGLAVAGVSGYLLDNSLTAFSIPIEDTYKTTVIRCRPPLNKLTQAAKRVDACKGLLLDEIREVQPRVIVPMGAVAIGLLLGDGGAKRWHGKIAEQDGFLIVPIYHPDAPVHQSSLQPVFEADFAAVARAYHYGKAAADPIDVGYVDTMNDALRVFEEVLARGRMPFDYETNAKTTWERPDLVIGLISIGLGTHRARALPWHTYRSPWVEVWSPAQFRELEDAWRYLLTAPDIDRIAHNKKFERAWSKAVFGVELGPTRDTMLSHVHENEEAPHDLKDIGWRTTDLGGYEEEFHTQLPDQENFLSSPLGPLAGYGCCDCLVTDRYDLRVQRILTPAQQSVLAMQEQLAVTLSRIEGHGKAVDEAQVAALRAEYQATGDQLEQEMLTWPEVNALGWVSAEIKRQGELAEIREEMEELVAQAEALPTPAADKELDAIGRKVKYREQKAGRLDPPEPEALEQVLRGYLEPVNFLSDLQARLLFLHPQCFGYPLTRFVTDTGQPSCGKNALLVWSKDHEQPRVFRRFKRVRHLQSQFLDPVPDLLQGAVDRMIHANLNQHIARTGRLSSSNPNEQNRPRDDTCKALGVTPLQLTMYVSRFPGGTLPKGDYSQLELRILASQSRCSAMLECYRHGWDLHTRTTVGMFPQTITDGFVELEQLTGKTASEARVAAAVLRATELPFPEIARIAAACVTWKFHRTVGKRCNFLTGYGGSGMALQAVLAEAGLYLSEEECDAFIDAWFRLYPEVAAYMADVVERARRNNGVVVAHDGRLRHLPALIYGDRGEQAAAGREAGNFGIQWPAAKLTMVALMILEEMLADVGARTLIVGTVHDSIILDSPADEAEDATQLLKMAMEQAALDERWAPAGWMHPDVPIVADIEH